MTQDTPPQLIGSIVALITPMQDDGSIDYTALRNLIDWHVEQGTDCISVAGTTGESSSITAAEQIEIIRVAMEQSNKRVPILAGCGSNSTHEAINLAKQAADLGVDYQLQVVPYYNKPTQAGIEQHFRQIAAVSPNVPMVLYNVPSRTGVSMDNDTILRLAEVDSIIGVKEASGNLIKGQDLINRAAKDFLIYSGDDLTAVFLMLAGGHGNISVSANIAPKLMHQLCHFAINGQAQQAMQIQRQLFDLHRNLFIQSNPIPVKWAVSHLGLCGPTMRSPLTQLEPAYSEIVKKALSNAKLEHLS